MCLWAILLSLCDACPFITILFQRMICVWNSVFWSARRERYTIDKSGLKHRERQDSQSWALKLHWCGIILYFASGAPLLLLSYHLSCPKLNSECDGYKKKLKLLVEYSSFPLCGAITCCSHGFPRFISLFLVSAASEYFGSQIARPADWRVSCVNRKLPPHRTHHLTIHACGSKCVHANKPGFSGL